MILTASNTLVINKDNQIRMFELPLLSEITNNPILQELKAAAEDGQNIQLYNADGKIQRLQIDSGVSNQFQQIEAINGKLMWLRQNDKTIIGSFSDGARYEKSIKGFPRWDFAQDRVLFEPVGFDCYEKDHFQKNWVLWYYRKNDTKSFSLDYEDLLKWLNPEFNSTRKP